MDKHHEQHKLECEARDWLKRGYRTPAQIKRRLKKHRTAENIEQLIKQMRIESERLRR